MFGLPLFLWQIFFCLVLYLYQCRVSQHFVASTVESFGIGVHFEIPNTKFFGIEKLDLSRNKNIGCGLGTKTHFWRPSLIHKVSISKKILTGNRK